MIGNLWTLLLLVLTINVVASYDIFPLTEYNITEVSAGDKNAGMAIINEDEAAPIRMAPTGDKKGAHLSSAADGIKSSGKKSAVAAAQELSGFSDLGASSQSLLNDNATGQSTVTKRLTPYLTYSNGTVMTKLSTESPFRVFLIFYGRSWSPIDVYAIKNFVDSISSTKDLPSTPSERHVRNWWLVTSNNYHDSANRPVSAEVKVRGLYLDPGSSYPLGSASSPLTDRDIKNIVSNAIKKRFSGQITRSSAFFVLTDKDTYVTDFCTSTCAYHSAFRNFGKTIAYSHVGDGSSICPNRCTFKYFYPSAKPATSLSTDGVVNWLAHELIDVATNPFQFTKRGLPGWIIPGTTVEVGDFCEWDFGFVGYNDQGGIYNVNGINGKHYLIQRSYSRKLEKCKINADNGNDAPF